MTIDVIVIRTHYGRQGMSLETIRQTYDWLVNVIQIVCFTK